VPACCRIPFRSLGVGGDVFLTRCLVLGWVSPRYAAALAPPFVLCDSAAGLGGVSLAGQTFAPGAILFSVGALVGTVIGTAIGLRWDVGAHHALRAPPAFTIASAFNRTRHWLRD
jgi:hypothetical protein